MNLNKYIRTIVCAISCLAIVAASAALVRQRPSALTATPTGKVTPWAAMRTAGARTGGKPFQATFEFEDGKWQYGVLVLKGGKISEVEIDATTGLVGDVEGITPAGEAKEAKAELEHMIKSGGS